jgi:hypothetical protein
MTSSELSWFEHEVGCRLSLAIPLCSSLDCVQAGVYRTKALVDMGTVPTPEGRVLVFPNHYQHCVAPITNTSKEVTRKCASLRPCTLASRIGSAWRLGTVSFCRSAPVCRRTQRSWWHRTCSVVSDRLLPPCDGDLVCSLVRYPLTRLIPVIEQV